MPDSASPQQLQHLRLEPLNQIAFLKLRQVGVAEDSTTLPVFCLMEWGLAVDRAFTTKRLPQELLRLRLMGNQRTALNYLLKNLPGGLPQLYRKLLSQSPQEAAQTLLDILDMRLRADPRNPYPSS